MVLAKINGQEYSVHRRLAEYWDKNTLERMNKQNSDRVYIVDGRERVGKSTFAIQQMGYIDPDAFKDVKTFLSRVCITVEEFNETARAIKNGVVIFDEAFRGFSSRSALSKVNKLLIQTLMEMGQNNNILFIVLPSFFLLDMYPAILRSNALFHLDYDKKSKVRIFKGYNNADKNFMYRMGARKGWNYKMTRFHGKYFSKFPGGEEFEEAYIKKKEQAFIKMSDSMKGTKVNKMEEENIKLKRVINKMAGSDVEGSKMIEEGGVFCSKSKLHRDRNKKLSTDVEKLPKGYVKPPENHEKSQIPALNILYNPQEEGIDHSEALEEVLPSRELLQGTGVTLTTN